jgi:N-acetylglutamate synthase-like GNAT family acetyltransferase
MTIRKPTEDEFKEVLLGAARMKLDAKNATIDQFVCVFSECGLAGFVRIKRTNKFLELATLGVVEDFRVQGVATLLMKYLQEEYKEIHLVTVIPTFFEKLGFIKLKSVPNELQEKFNNSSLWHGFGKPVSMRYRN